MSNELKREYELVKTDIEGISTFTAELSSNHQNEYLRPEALTIRMQEKLLEKIDKFPDPDDDVFSVVVVDCSDFHFGGFDGEDCRMVMFGRTNNPYLREHWRGNPILGTFDDSRDKRGASEFRERVTAVVFVPQIKVDLLNQAFVVPNVRRSGSHLGRFQSRCREVPVLSGLKCVLPPAG
jgi:hypothetical protein